MTIGKRVIVSYARMGGRVISLEQYADGDPLYEVELDDGEICYATASQISEV